MYEWDFMGFELECDFQNNPQLESTEIKKKVKYNKNALRGQ